MIASFLVSELEEFMEDLPDVGSKLMRMLGRMALSKQASNLRDELADKVTPALEWKCERRPVSTAELEQLPLDERGLATDDDRAAFVARLDEAGFSTSEAELLSTVAQYHSFEANETLVTAGSRFPFLFFVLQGSVWVTRWGLEVSEGGQVSLSRGRCPRCPRERCCRHVPSRPHARLLASRRASPRFSSPDQAPQQTDSAHVRLPRAAGWWRRILHFGA